MDGAERSDYTHSDQSLSASTLDVRKNPSSDHGIRLVDHGQAGGKASIDS